MVELDNIWQRFRPALEAELKHVVGGSSLPLYSMMRYHMGWIDELGRAQRSTAGKRLRPSEVFAPRRGGVWGAGPPGAPRRPLVAGPPGAPGNGP